MSRSKASKPGAESRAWNQGLTGTATKGAHVPVTETCGTEGCGIPEDVLDEGDPTVWGWVLARVNGSQLEGRWFCCGECANRGIARAELRMRPEDGGAPC